MGMNRLDKHAVYLGRAVMKAVMREVMREVMRAVMKVVMREVMKVINALIRGGDKGIGKDIDQGGDKGIGQCIDQGIDQGVILMKMGKPPRPTIYPPSTQSGLDLKEEFIDHIPTQQSQTTKKKRPQVVGPSPWQQLQMGRGHNSRACPLDAEGNEDNLNICIYVLFYQLNGKKQGERGHGEWGRRRWSGEEGKEFIYAMRHMESYMGGGTKGWDCGLQKNNASQLSNLRTKYSAAIIIHHNNELKDRCLEEARKFWTGKIVL
ncbi:hypothetical protein DH2020_014343 [Rehmannia glutinosa]|uniref:Uncharacterized protein n=1 Tax=Rehmannia glutinosa TaxID=99300 RepID=A0ABR0WW54_REHGL